MRFAAIGIIVIALVVPATEAVRLEPPNISGTWLFDPDHRAERSWLRPHPRRWEEHERHPRQDTERRLRNPCEILRRHIVSLVL